MIIRWMLAVEVGGEKVNTEVKKSKKEALRRLLIAGSIFGLLFIGIIGYGIYWAFFDMERLPTREYLTEETSPDGSYTLKAYLTNGGATTSYAVRGELVFNNRNSKTKNIYWNYREETAEIKWLDDSTVVINGHKLSVPKEKFDFRRQQ